MNLTLASLESICRDYHSRIEKLEDEKYDFEYIVKGKDFQVHKTNLPTKKFAKNAKAENQMRKFFF